MAHLLMEYGPLNAIADRLAPTSELTLMMRGLADLDNKPMNALFTRHDPTTLTSRHDEKSDVSISHSGPVATTSAAPTTAAQRLAAMRAKREAAKAAAAK